MFMDLKTKEIIKIKDNKGLSFIYNNFFGRVILKIMTTKLVANIYALFMNSKLSKYKIKKFIKNNNIDMSIYQDCDYKSFNDFFMRSIKDGMRVINKGLISVCDSKLSVYKITNDLCLNIKNSKYTIDELIGEDGSRFKDGYALVYRLCVDDYHHYVFPDDGRVVSTKHIKGKLHTVQPIALKKYKVFSENSRCVTMLDTKKYGTLAYIEIGAMMIGKIVNLNKQSFKKGEEKGHFEFGGSTIVLLYEKDRIKINKLILDNTKKDIETIVKLGDNLE